MSRRGEQRSTRRPLPSSTDRDPARVAGRPPVADTPQGQELPPDAVAEAISILVERDDCTEDEATELLIDRALRTGVGLTDVVARVVEHATVAVPEA
jgi:hypothetical protein